MSKKLVLYFSVYGTAKKLAEEIAELDLGHSEIVDHGSPKFVKGLNSWKV